MEKDFNEWNDRKKKIDSKTNRVYFKEGEIWWLHLGLNVGYEANGKSKEYLRPVIILKKYNMYSFLSISLTTSIKINNYRIPVGRILNKEAVANMSQLRYLDSKRLAKKIGTMDRTLFSQIKKKASEINFQ